MAISLEARADRVESIRGLLLINSALRAIVQASNVGTNEDVTKELAAINLFITAELNRLEKDIGNE